jgi:hypothetical protein
MECQERVLLASGTNQKPKTNDHARNIQETTTPTLSNLPAPQKTKAVESKRQWRSRLFFMGW